MSPGGLPAKGARSINASSPGRGSAQEYHAGLAIVALVQLREAAFGGRGFVCGHLRYDQRAGRQPSALVQRAQRRIDQPLAVGRIEKDQIERPARSCRHRSQVGRVAPPDFRDARKPQCFDVRADQCPAFRAVVHKQAEGSAVRKRLDAKRACPREQVGHARALQRHAEIVVMEDVEDRLPRLVRSRAHGRIRRCRQRPPPQGSTGDPHRSFRMKWRACLPPSQGSSANCA